MTTDSDVAARLRNPAKGPEGVWKSDIDGRAASIDLDQAIKSI
jgi:hypothetical protein